MKNTSLKYSRYFTYIQPLTRLPIIKNYGPYIFAFLTISVLTFFAIRPTLQTILVLQKELSNTEEILRKVEEKANNLSLAKKNYDEMDPNIKLEIFTVIPDTLNLKSLISALEETALAHEASVSALQIQPVVLNAKNTDHTGIVSEVSFIFNTEGEYENLIGILQDLRRSSRLISIGNLSLSKSGGERTLIMSLSGKAYYLK